MRAAAVVLTLVGCGRLNFGELADATADRDGALDDAPDAASACIVEVDAGDGNACAVRGDGTVWCWGTNGRGVFGIEASTLPSSATPVQVPGVTGAVDVGISMAGYACALLGDGRVSCWGANYNLLADSTCCSGHVAPTVVPGIAEVRQLAVGEFSICVIKTDGTVWCWGADNNELGMLGARAGGVQNLWTDGIQPVTDPGNQAAAIAGGFGFTCVIKTDGTVWCWGENSGYQLGTMAVGSSAIPLQVAITGAQAVDLGSGSTFACATRSDASLWCWGAGVYGELGDGMTGQFTPTPVRVTGLTTAQPPAFSAGTNQTCARRDDNTLACWGYNQTFSPLGTGSVGVNQPTPQTVSSLGAPVVELAAGWAKICAALADSTLVCWGNADEPTPTPLAFACP